MTIIILPCTVELRLEKWHEIRIRSDSVVKSGAQTKARLGPSLSNRMFVDWAMHASTQGALQRSAEAVMKKLLQSRKKKKKKQSSPKTPSGSPPHPTPPPPPPAGPSGT
ncbi:hypothetical protein Tco_1105004 [Tanacetum coccineum]